MDTSLEQENVPVWPTGGVSTTEHHGGSPYPHRYTSEVRQIKHPSKRHFLENLLRTDEAEVKLFRRNDHHLKWNQKGKAIQHQHSLFSGVRWREHHDLGLLLTKMFSGTMSWRLSAS